MTVIFYKLFCWFFRAGIGIASIFDAKARKWVTGRRKIFEELQTRITKDRKIVWVHCASLGEFEQGRPLIEQIRKDYPNCRILLSFFSPSGYEIRNNYPGADWVFYLPMDGAANAKKFLDIVAPSLVVFVKYEFWYFYLEEVHKRGIPLLLVSAIFRENAVFFKWYGSLHRRMLGFFSQLFVQNENSKTLLQENNLAQNVTVAGDTRFDRVRTIADHFEPIPLVEDWIGNDPVIVAGSTWPEDEQMLRSAVGNITHPRLRLIIAPHEVDNNHLSSLQKLFPGSVRYSQLSASSSAPPASSSHILLIDNIGMLSRLYQYATITYVGGGFGNGIHNILEAAVHGKPVLFGPKHQKFQEAIDLIREGGAFTFNKEEILAALLEKFLMDKTALASASQVAGNFVASRTGATRVIMNYIQVNRLLTS